eukprot:1774824-Amphidinium_carterae.1
MSNTFRPLFSQDFAGTVGRAILPCYVEPFCLVTLRLPGMLARSYLRMARVSPSTRPGMSAHKLY